MAAAEITLDHADAQGRSFLTWAPLRGTIRLSTPAAAPVDVVLGNAGPAPAAQLEFAAKRADARAATLQLTLPADGSPSEFFVAGAWKRPSTPGGDGTIAASQNGTALATKPVRVRIRKDANTLTPAEKLAFTNALAKLNDKGAGLFQHYRDMHKEPVALNQAHGRSGFLPWHRAYLLDLERELQKLDPLVTLPYWRFDQPAPNVFTQDFMGETRVSGNVPSAVVFAPQNLLREWKTDGQAGISRSAQFDPRTGRGFTLDQAQTLALGGANAIFDDGQAPAQGHGFDSMEGNPHGLAHTSYTPGSWIFTPATAPKDPMFFLLHCNVDRLWALWQFTFHRYDGTDPKTFHYQGQAGQPGATLIGHNLHDTMWPWNNKQGQFLPATAPRTPFPVVPTAPAPSDKPAVGDMLDYHGVLHPDAYQGFAYDTIPYG